MKPYAEYKPTEVFWQPRAPKHWIVRKLKHVLIKLDRSRSTGAELLVCTNKGTVIRRGDSKLGLVADNDEIYQGVAKGDLLIHGMDTWHGAIAVSSEDGMCTPVVHVCDSSENKSFIAYYLRNMAVGKVFKLISNGVRQNTSDFRSWDKVSELSIILPPPDEQAKIVAYLDAKTAKIDRLIKLKEREIELLQEKKQAVISQVVTRGLDPNVELVDSGVGWISKIPKGWKVVSFKSLFDFKKGLNITKDDLVETGCAVISYGQIHSKFNDGLHLDSSLLRFVPHALTDEKSCLCVGDIVFADTSEDIEGCGNAILVDSESRVYGGYHTLIAKARKPNVSLFLSALFRARIWREQLWRKVNGVKVYSVTQKVFSGVTVIIPDDSEVSVLNDHILKSVAEANYGVRLIQKQIALLREYRTRLISDAVTGRIDLREVS